MNMMIMYQVHHLSTEKEGKNLKSVPESLPIYNNQGVSMI